MTIQEALTQGTARLKSAGGKARIDTPALDAALLLADILKTTRTGLVLAAPNSLAEDKRLLFDRALERRLAGECAAYILGRREFRGLDFCVNPGVLVPRPDTETLVEAALEYLADTKLMAAAQTRGGPESSPHPAPLLLDLCTGSGAVAISLKNECPGLTVYASDISQAALAVARTNAGRLLSVPAADSQANSAAVRFIESDLFDRIPLQPCFDIIVSNPPYVPAGIINTLSAEVQGEPRLALDGGEDGLDLIRCIIIEGKEHLAAGGGLFLEADPGQMDTIGGILVSRGYIDIKTYRDLSGKPRVISGKSGHR
jgi:release factor glutamine methyltransferase